MLLDQRKGADMHSQGREVIKHNRAWGLDILPGLKSGDSRDFTQRGSRSWSTTGL